MATGGNQNLPMAYDSSHAVLAKDAPRVGGSGQMQQKPQHTVVRTMPGQPMPGQPMPGQPMPGQPMPVQYGTVAPYGGGGAYGGGGGYGRGGLNNNAAGNAAGCLIGGVACVYIVVPCVCCLAFVIIAVIMYVIFAVQVDNQSKKFDSEKTKFDDKFDSDKKKFDDEWNNRHNNRGY